MKKLFGRETEEAEIDALLNSEKPEFIAVYGRRRVGKTFLVKEHLRGKLTFYVSGVINEDARTQQKAFRQALEDNGAPEPKNSSWLDMFHSLRLFLQPKIDKGEKCIIFIDEMPCFDTPRAGFIAALDHFWNSWASDYDNMKLIVCGSATSWMIKNLINSHGGLHNRLTYTIHLHPFTLCETEQYFRQRRILWNRNTILQAYMVFGGIPFYLSLIQQGESLPQAIDRLYFSKDAPLRTEYSRLMASLFRVPEPYNKVIETLSSRSQGMSRQEISQSIGMKTGGNLTKILTELENCDFIRSYRTREKKVKLNDCIYQLTDMFVMFHLHFSRKGITNQTFWQDHLGSAVLYTWQGLTFEKVVLLHIAEIKQALGIGRIGVEYYAWRSRYSEPASQIDLILDRADNTVNLCEMKYSIDEYTMTSDEEAKMRRRKQNFMTETHSRQAIRLTMITPFGVKQNEHSSDIADYVTMDNLFEQVR